jgi:phage tail sheath protein FI
MDHDASLTEAGTDIASGATYTSGTGDAGVIVATLSGGTDDYAATVGELDLAYDLFADTETVDINLIMAGTCPAGTDGVTHATNLIDLAEARKDVVAFISPRRADVVGIASSITQTSNVKGFFDQLSSSSYAVFDSGYKYMYDKYNDVYRHVPLNGDIAGLAANTDNVADPWFSPAGFNRGQIRGVVKLAYNPNKSQRDILYPARINPVVTFPGQGTVLFGDKTALSRPSAFDRINVRRLFIVLEKAISTASKFQLFEFNDEFTRAQFRNLVEPFLRDVQGRRGITDFSVVADETNNTGEVIDRNEFVADIYIKPARSINFITLNFIATRTGVAFSEIGG